PLDGLDSRTEQLQHRVFVRLDAPVELHFQHAAQTPAPGVDGIQDLVVVDLDNEAVAGCLPAVRNFNMALGVFVSSQCGTTCNSREQRVEKNAGSSARTCDRDHLSDFPA